MTKRMLMVGLVFVAACVPFGDASGGTDDPSSTTAPVSSTSEAPPATTLLSATTVPPTTTTVETGPVADLVIELPGVIEKVDVSDFGVVALGYDDQDNQQMLWVSTDFESWSGVGTRDLFADDPVLITDVAVFDGRFLASLVGGANADSTAPVVLSSQDGVTWRGGSLAGAPHFRTVAFTPESPPWPGPTGVSDLEVVAGVLYAAGWVTSDTGSSAAVWESSDGQNWDVTVLPNITFPTEWVSDLSVGSLGLLVAVGGPVYAGAGAQYSADGDSWNPVGAVDGWAAVTVSQNAGLLSILRFDLGESFVYDLLVSGDGRQWESAPPMPVAMEGATLGSGATWDPVVFARPGGAEAFVFDRGVWSVFPVGDWDQILDITELHLIGTDDGRLLVVDRYEFPRTPPTP